MLERKEAAAVGVPVLGECFKPVSQVWGVGREKNCLSGEKRVGSIRNPLELVVLNPAGEKKMSIK